MNVKKKKLIPILACTVAVILMAAGTILLLNSNVFEKEKPVNMTLDEIKNYLSENYDRFKIDGSTSMIPLHQFLNRIFSKEGDQVTHSRSVEAFEKLTAGEIDILLAVDYSDELFKKAKKSGANLSKKEITKEGFIFLMNKENPVKSLTIDQIKGIYSGKITNWNQVGGDNAPVKAYQRNADSGSQMRMVKFMGKEKLSEKDIEYVERMDQVIEQVAMYDVGKYSIAYNMYTFTEKQNRNENIELFKVNGVYPNDQTVFSDEYPLVIYNYIHYNKKNKPATEFANILYQYLMSGEGQRIISNSGYVNLNEKHDRNTDVFLPADLDDIDDGIMWGFYNQEKGEFYSVDENNKLVIYNNYPDYVLRYSEYKDNANARSYLTTIFNSNIPLNPRTTCIYNDGTIGIEYWSYDYSFDPEDFFNVKYKDKYYSVLKYNILEDSFFLDGSNKEYFDLSDKYGDFEDFKAYKKDVVFIPVTNISKEELKNVGFRTDEYNYKENDLEYIYPFK